MDKKKIIIFSAFFILFVAIIALLYSYLKIKEKNDKIYNQMEVHGSYRTGNNNPTEIKYVTFDTEMKEIIFYKQGDNGFEEIGTYEKSNSTNCYEIEFGDKEASMIYLDDCMWLIVDNKPVFFEKYSEIMDTIMTSD